MKFVVDMNLTPQWVEHLNAVGYQAVHWSTVGENDAEDGDIVSWAREHDCVVLTGDLDFGTILAMSGVLRPSVVQLRSEATLPARVGSAVIEAIQESETDLLAGALLTIEAMRSRLRILPFNHER
jgi:predicted nuclease of predicted toxin-antitoxin system